MTIPGLIWIDRVGRRPILLLGSTLMATWLFANAGILAVYGTDPGPNGVGGIKEASVQVSGAASKAVIACSYLVSLFLFFFFIHFFFLLFSTFTPYKPTELTQKPHLVRRLLRTHLGPRLLDLSSRIISQPSPRQSRRTRHLWYDPHPLPLKNPLPPF